MAALDITVMGGEDLARAADWAAAEGWNPGLLDMVAFQAADPQGFLVARLGAEPVSCISVVRYGSDFGFLGFYLATPDVRGKGYGLAVWKAGMAHLAGRNVGLDGVPAQQENYKRSGFRLAWRNIRYQGRLPTGPAASGGTISDARSLSFEKLAAYDRRFFPAPRDSFLSVWLGLPGHVSVAALRGGEIAGLAVMRPCRSALKIGPLYADDDEVARGLIGHLASRAGGAEVALDVTERNKAAVRLAEELGLKPAFETARMYTGPEPKIDLARLYGVTTFELG